ncbi:D-glucuronyl C5-epimerase family protein [Endozoicomonas sp. 4G]|uniref:D-glucuronyl C5-epimerase family protein n=1 Tax=Endozoicomonas sp. 4G TaxID=2872754 RepID=UPI002078700E|nr:D-glucuronyl C5-epimerase family protein [Endozoicomonas sp. 4G]
MKHEKIKVFNKEFEFVEFEGKKYIEENYIFSNKLIKKNHSYGYDTPKYCTDSYDHTKDYLKFSELDVKSWRIVSDDEFGIPINTYAGNQHHYPITIAHYGLQLFGKIIKPYTCYMGGHLEHSIDFSIERGNISLKAGTVTGYSLPLLFGSLISSIEIKPESIFRVHIKLSNKETVIVYEGDSKLIKGARYLSLEDFKKLDPNLNITDLRVRGSVNIAFCKDIINNPCYKEMLKVADWFVLNQASDGSWKSYFEHVFYLGRTDPMSSGWSSALGQGLAISFLTRVYHITGNKKYLNACIAGLNPFEVKSEDGGVLTYWDGQYMFYEEYPTSPASFVLNGFIFSLIGLYDLSQYGVSKAAELFNKGFLTLKKILPLYDLGNKSAYDLTHYTCMTFPNIARWGYHITHINQLFAMYCITGDENINTFYSRWKSYLDEGFSCRTN